MQRRVLAGALTILVLMVVAAWLAPCDAPRREDKPAASGEQDHARPSPSRPAPDRASAAAPDDRQEAQAPEPAASAAEYLLIVRLVYADGRPVATAGATLVAPTFQLREAVRRGAVVFRLPSPVAEAVLRVGSMAIADDVETHLAFQWKEATETHTVTVTPRPPRSLRVVLHPENRADRPTLRIRTRRDPYSNAGSTAWNPFDEDGAYIQDDVRHEELYVFVGAVIIAYDSQRRALNGPSFPITTRLAIKIALAPREATVVNLPKIDLASLRFFVADPADADLYETELLPLSADGVPSEASLSVASPDPFCEVIGLAPGPTRLQVTAGGRLGIFDRLIGRADHLDIGRLSLNLHETTVEVVLLDVDGTPLAGQDIHLSSYQHGLQALALHGRTNEEGIVVFPACKPGWFYVTDRESLARRETVWVTGRHPHLRLRLQRLARTGDKTMWPSSQTGVETGTMTVINRSTQTGFLPMQASSLMDARMVGFAHDVWIYSTEVAAGEWYIHPSKFKLADCLRFLPESVQRVVVEPNGVTTANMADLLMPRAINVSDASWQTISLSVYGVARTGTSLLGVLDLVVRNQTVRIPPFLLTDRLFYRIRAISGDGMTAIMTSVWGDDLAYLLETGDFPDTSTDPWGLRVMSPEGQPLWQTKLTVLSNGGREASAAGLVNGEYAPPPPAVARQRPGRLRIYATAPGYSAGSIEWTLGPASGRATQEIVLWPDTGIRVECPHGPARAVRLMDAQERVIAMRDSVRDNAPANSVLFSSLAPGSYSIGVTGEDGRTHTVSVPAVAPGEERVVTVR